MDFDLIEQQKGYHSELNCVFWYKIPGLCTLKKNQSTT